MKQVAICFIFMLFAFFQEGFAADIVWQTSKQAAVQLAKQQDKKVLLVAGRDTCYNTNSMRFRIIEMLDPPVKELVEQNYLPWYSNVDTTNEWWSYASGLGSFTLPLICVIDPASSSTYLDRSTGIQDANSFYNRLKSFVKPPEQPPVQPQKSFLLYVPSLIKR